MGSAAPGDAKDLPVTGYRSCESRDSQDRQASNSNTVPWQRTQFNSCTVCGGYRGRLGDKGDRPFGRGGQEYLGPCGHEESRGQRGPTGDLPEEYTSDV